MRAALLCLVSVWALVVSPVVVLAAKGNKVNKELKRGIAAYNDLEYERAVKLITAALKKKLDKKGQLDAYRYLGLSHLALGNKDDAREAFRKLLEVDSSYTLPSIDSPVAIELFEEEKKIMAGGGARPSEKPAEAASQPAPDTPSVAAPTLESSLDPATPSGGQAVTVMLMVLPADISLASVTLYHRRQGGGGYSSVKAESQGGGRWTAVIPGAFVAGPAIEYYAVALDEDSQPRAAAGSEADPLVIVVGEEEAPTGTPFYAKWWFWAGVGGVVVAGAAAGFLLTRDSGGEETGFIDVTLNPPP